MKILFLPNWKILQTSIQPDNMQPPDYYLNQDKYWFFRYMSDVHVTVVDIASMKFVEKIEKNILHFYIVQTFRALLKISNYDLIVSHGMQSGIVLALIRKIFKWPKTPHIIFDIGSFNSARESGFSLKVMQFASKSIDGIIYHTSKQYYYYEKYFPWLLDRIQFIPFGADLSFFSLAKQISCPGITNPYIICIGSIKRDWDTLFEAFSKVSGRIHLKVVGNAYLKVKNPRIEIIPRVSIIELIALIQGSNFCILPLDNYNYSYGQMTLLQQMALKKTVIVAQVPPMEDYVVDNKTAIFYESKNADDLKAKIECCLRNPVLVESIGNNAYWFIHNHFNEQLMAERVYLFIRHYT